MAWQTPKTDWSAEDGVRDTDLNRIEANILELYKGTVRANQTVYVSMDGDDTNGLGTSASPYRTIKKALDMLPKNLAGLNANVHIASGTYSEAITVKGFVGGMVRLIGDASFAEVNSLTVDGCSVYITSLTLSAVAAVGYIVTNGGLLITTGGLDAEGSSTGVNVNNGSKLHVAGTLSCPSAANILNCSGNSTIYADRISGIGLMNATTGGVVVYSSSTASKYTATGGRFYTGAQSSTGNSLATAEILEEDA